MNHNLVFILILAVFFSCSDDGLEEKGFPVHSSDSEHAEPAAQGIHSDTLVLKTQPSGVLLTGHSAHRITTLYRVNYTKDSIPFIGSNYTHYNYSDPEPLKGNNWNSHLIPGLSAVYGYNMVNVSHHDHSAQAQNNFFTTPVLIKTLYYPSFDSDTLNFTPVLRNYYLVSAYDEDTNRDGFINLKDLRRFYFFDLNGTGRQPLLPINYSVIGSDYDSANDFLHVFAQLDENKNGRRDPDEAIHIFWVDLKNPLSAGRLY
jgi:hypothetical protein